MADNPLTTGVGVKRKVPLEASITKSIITKLNRLDRAYFRKVHGTRYSSGWPDVVGVLDGRPVFLEVKRPGNASGWELTERQAKELERWAATGAVVGVVTSWQEVVDVLKHAGIVTR